VGKEVNRAYTNIRSTIGERDISECKKGNTWTTWGSINIIVASYRRSSCTREVKCAGKYTNKFLKSCVELMKDRTMLSMLYNMIDHCTKGRDTPVAQRMVNQVLRRKRTNGEFRFNAQIGEYDVDNVILDLGSDVNVLPKKTWEMMGEPELVWSPVQLRLVNQHKIVPIG
jgi:hypothetical protein